MASLKVAVRVRPFNQREIDMGANLIVEMDGKKTRLHKPKLSSMRDTVRETINDFTFDYSYWSFDSKDKHFTTQEQVYEDLGTDVINCAFQGYNACVFAYGQTGSGKTYTMMGTENELGLVPKICKEMFNRMKLGQETGTGYKTCVSYLEIYNERVKDLLGSDNSGHGLRVREHRTTGPYVEDLSQHPVSDYDEILECISQGNILRTTASTNMNDTSSRSHAIFTITFVQAGFMDDMPSETVSKIHLVDLAGSERANATGATGQRLKEGAHINKSLVTLGSVISALADQTNPVQQKKVLYIPYRDSVLTWLLKDSLGGNSKTIMIAALSPADCNYGETLSTLRYANRAKNIINKPTINEDPNVKLIRELREEIMKLKGMINGENFTMELEMSTKVLEDLLKKEAQEKVLTEEWTEKWREAQTILREQKALGLRKSGLGVVLDSEVPHLIGIHDDVSTGVTLYSLKDGDTFIGTGDSELCQDIVLNGSGIQSNHCSIRLENGLATIYPNENSQCWINANLIDEPTRISQGDILLLGRTNMFRYNNPAEAAKLRKEGSRSRLDLSRLSLIAASRENLTSSMYCDDEIAFAYPMKRGPSELQLSREYPEVQEENKKILQTIESALKQLNIEKINMNEQYRNKVQRISEELVQLEQNQCDKMAIINCRERELLAKKEMILWEKSNADTQIEILTKQISALQTQLDAKKRDFYDFVAREVQRLQNCGKLNEIDIDLIDHIIESGEINDKFLDVFHNQYIQDTIVKNKEEIKILECDINAKENLLDENSSKVESLDKEVLEIYKNQEQLIIQRTDLEYEAIKMKKQSLSLNIESAAAAASNQNVSNQFTNTLETYDTFHTATSDCSTTFSTPSGLHQTSLSVTTTDLQQSQSTMSDSGVSVDDTHKTNITNTTPSCQIRSDDDNSSSLSGGDNFSAVLPRPICAIHKLRQKIGQQKAQIMKYLEMDCDKSILDDRIEKLQQLQKEYFKLEKSYRTENASPYEHECCLSDGEFGGSEVRSSDERLSIMSPDIQNDVMTRSMPSIGNYNDSEYSISIPSFIVRGAGKQTHYEYEIRISLHDDKWTLLRRYSKFRELHLKMKSIYGVKISAIPFPGREIFSIGNSESVARNRRRQLEIYLRRLVVVCSKIPQCPIYEGADGFGLCKTTLIEFSGFFKKGLFESGKHGTG